MPSIYSDKGKQTVLGKVEFCWYKSIYSRDFLPGHLEKPRTVPMPVFTKSRGSPHLNLGSARHPDIRLPLKLSCHDGKNSAPHQQKYISAGRHFAASCTMVPIFTVLSPEICSSHTGKDCHSRSGQNQRY